LIGVRFTIGKDGPLANARPGQHVYIRRGGLLRPKNPFTIANVRPVLNEDDGGGAAAVGDGGLGSGAVGIRVRHEKDRNEKALMSPKVEVQLVLRNTGGPQTSWLANVAKGGSHCQGTTVETKGSTAKTRPSSIVELQVEGPYGESGTYIPRLLDKATRQPSSHGQTLLVAGGVGATYTIPIYLALLASQRTRGRSGGEIKMIWLVKTLDAARWGIDTLSQAQQAQQQLSGVGVDIYVTRSSKNKEEEEEEMVEVEGQVDEATNTARFVANHIHIHRLGHRPDLKSIVDALAASGTGKSKSRGISDSHGDQIDYDSRKATKKNPSETPQQKHRAAQGLDPVTVFLCGPSSLARDVRSALTKYVDEGRHVDIYEEVFGLGGS
jgi:hypothetical protein